MTIVVELLLFAAIEYFQLSEAIGDTKSKPKDIRLSLERSLSDTFHNYFKT